MLWPQGSALPFALPGHSLDDLNHRHSSLVFFFPLKISGFILLSYLTEESSELEWCIWSAHGNGTYPCRNCKLLCQLVTSPEIAL